MQKTVNINGTEIELFKPVEFLQAIGDEMVPVYVFKKGEEIFNQLLRALDGCTFEKKTEIETEKKWSPNECKNCYGKGYATQLEAWSGSDEWTGKKYVQQAPYYLPCTCDRGKQIERLIERTKEDAYREIMKRE